MLESQLKKIKEVEKALDGKVRSRSRPIGNDFTEEIAIRKCYCSECGEIIIKDQKCLVSIYRGKIQKRICGEDCRQNFDARFWMRRARMRSREVIP